MQAFSWLSGNKALIFGVAAVAVIVAALLLLLVFRLVFGRRLRMSSSRGRQLRLGIVDAFDLDRQRQLVIVRRDNTEHLIMIGGPNDVLIESHIVRAEAREPRQRDKDMRDLREKERMEPLVPPQPVPVAAEPQQLPSFRPDAPPVPRENVPPHPAPAPVQPAARVPRPPQQRPDLKPAAAPVPQKPPAPPESDVPALPPIAPAVASAEPSAPPPQPVEPAKAPARTLPPANQGFMRWRPNQGGSPVQRPAGAASSEPPRPPRDANPPASGPVQGPATPPVTPPPAADNRPARAEPALPFPLPESSAPKADTPAPAPLEADDMMTSLEEEMAKLLGRVSDRK